MELNKKAFGLAAGVVCGIAVLGLTLWSSFAGQEEHLSLLEGFFLGYSVSLGGALV